MVLDATPGTQRKAKPHVQPVSGRAARLQYLTVYFFASRQAAKAFLNSVICAVEVRAAACHKRRRLLRSLFRLAPGDHGIADCTRARANHRALAGVARNRTDDRPPAAPPTAPFTTEADVDACACCICCAACCCSCVAWLAKWNGSMAVSFIAQL